MQRNSEFESASVLRNGNGVEVRKVRERIVPTRGFGIRYAVRIAERVELGERGLHYFFVKK